MSKKRMIYVGGLEQSVSEEVLHAAFIPFGNIKEVSIPKDFKESMSAYILSFPFYYLLITFV